MSKDYNANTAQCEHIAVIEFRDLKSGELMFSRSKGKVIHAIKKLAVQHNGGHNCAEAESELKQNVIAYMQLISRSDYEGVIYNVGAYRRLKAFMKERYE